VLGCNATSDCRFACTAAAADPVNVAELIPKQFGVSFGLHASTF